MAVHLRRQAQTVMAVMEHLLPYLEPQLLTLVAAVALDITVVDQVREVLAAVGLALLVAFHLCTLLPAQQIPAVVAVVAVRLADTAHRAATAAPAS